MSTDPSPPDTTVEIIKVKLTTATEPAEAANPGDAPVQDVPEIEPKTSGSGPGDSDIKMY